MKTLLLLPFAIFFLLHAALLNGQATISGGVSYGGVRMDNNFSISDGYFTRNAEGRATFGTFGLYFACDWTLFERLRLELNAGGTYGNIVRADLEAHHSTANGFEHFVINHDRQTGMAWAAIMLGYPVMSRKWKDRLYVSTGFIQSYYSQRYLRALTYDATTNIVDQRIYVKEHHSSWGIPLQAHYRQPLNPRLSLDFKCTGVTLKNTLQGIAQIGLAYKW